MMAETAEATISVETKRRVDWTINPSFLLSLTVAVVAVIGACFTFVLNLREDIHASSTRFDGLISEIRAANTLQDAEIKALKDYNIVTKQEEVQFRGDVRSGIGDLNKLLTDVRIQNAERGATSSTRR